ncbi:alpha/beta hydrolase [Intrasporangium sp.]|uniref:alpha/beta hydrolase n=1 Tax=Intrasporangium sp. TaxID=1925024 RepID=UPI00322145B1
MNRDGWEGAGTAEARAAQLADLAKQRWADVDGGEPALQPQFPDTVPEGLDPITAEFFEYYVKSNDRGRHPRSIGAFTLTSFPAHINFGALRNLEDIAPRPALVVTGDRAHSKWMSDEVVAKTDGAAEEVVVPGARHIDLYDDTALIPFDRLEAFFTEHLR